MTSICIENCFPFATLSALVAPAFAAIDPMTGPIYMGRVSGDLDQWQRIDFRSANRKLPQLRYLGSVRIPHQTRGGLGAFRRPGD